ncbi:MULTISPECIES: TerC family protein [unclassified Gemella]|uniref:TerC family protein n=1 Tax=unclassified Gemella TaxID=2624949 RepID=UPI001C05CA23|nr:MULTISPECIES: TerC family protein [unclassified Gemella]MBU0278806.1 TerC family protein [Gemella sp. zg-1178]QWQ39356.1 TerC family protein [Gemella sp. zg-570]
MDTQILIQYLIVLLSLILLEGLLSADNAIVLAIMVRHLPLIQQKKALMYGLVGALVFRIIAIFLITVLVQYWQIQVVGGLYLLYMSITHIKEFYKKLNAYQEYEENGNTKNQSGFWDTVIKVELTDIAFAVDSILAAVAIAITLPHISETSIGGINLGQFVVMVLGGIIGVIIMRFAANIFIKILNDQPGLELAAFLIVAWVGIKLFVIAAANKKLGYLPHEFPHSTLWTVIFWVVLFGLLLFGIWYSKKLNSKINEINK